MENNSHYMDEQLKEYKRAIADTYKQFQLDDESRISAASATIRSAIAEYKSVFPEDKDRKRSEIEGMLKLALACHLVSFDDIAKYKKEAGIENINMFLKISF